MRRLRRMVVFDPLSPSPLPVTLANRYYVDRLNFSMRTGGWEFLAILTRTSRRRPIAPYACNDDTSFRVVRGRKAP